MTNSNTPEPNRLMAQLGHVYGQPPWSLSEALLTLAVLALCMFLIGSMIAAALSPNQLNPTPVALIAGWMAGLVLAAAFVLIRWRRSPERFAALRITGETAAARRPLALLMLIGVATALTADLVAASGSTISDVQNNFSTVAALQGLYQNTSLAELVLAALFVMLVQPLVESLIFFGVVQPRLRVSIGAWPGLITSALLFAGFHYLVYGARPIINSPLWYGFVMPLVIGMVFAVIRVWMRSTRAAAAVYVGYGITTFLTMLAIG